MKLIVTHLSPDLDAIASCWLIRRFLPKWERATVSFVPAGSTFHERPPDEDPEIIHVDTGLGKFDHHQNNKNTCAAKLVFDDLVRNGHIPSRLIPPLERMVQFITVIDHFGEVYFPDPTNDRYEFLLHQIIESLKNEIRDDLQTTEYVFVLFDGVLNLFKNKIAAEKEIKKGYIFQSKWGKTLAMESGNEEAMKLALKMGFDLVIRKNPIKGNIRIKAFPKANNDLTALHKRILSLDQQATWFFHASGHILINGSSKNPHSVPSKLTLAQLIEIIKKM